MEEERTQRRGLAVRLRVLETIQALTEVVLTRLHGEIHQTIARMDILNTAIETQEEEIRRLSRDLERLQNIARRQGIQLCQKHARIRALESVSYSGTLMWKIQNVLDGGRISIESPMLYTSRHGYALSARAYSAGYGEGTGSHLSLSFAIRSHDLDDLKQWPFQQRVTFRLVNQNGGDHIVRSVTPDPTRPEFQKPTTASNPAFHIPWFVPLEALRDPGQGFVVDNTVFIQITVDTTGLSEPLAHIQ